MTFQYWIIGGITGNEDNYCSIKMFYKNNIILKFAIFEMRLLNFQIEASCLTCKSERKIGGK
jgi:hypothetical protein